MKDADPEWFTTVLAADNLPRAARVRGLADKITVTASCNDTVGATVVGSGDRNYAVILDLADPLGASTCDCPQNAVLGKFCKHLLAVSLTAAGREIGEWTHVVPPQTSPTEPSCFPQSPRPPSERAGQPVSTGAVSASRRELPDVESLPELVPALRSAVETWDAVCRDPESSKAAERRARAAVTDLLQKLLVDGAFTTGASTTGMLAIGDAAELYRRAGRPRHALAAMEQCALRCPTEETYGHLFALFRTPTYFGPGKRAQLRAWYRDRLENCADDLTDSERALKMRLDGEGVG